MSDFKRIPVKINAATGKQIDEKGSVIREAEFFRLLFDETVIICAEMVDVVISDGEVVMSEHPVPDSMILAAFGDSDFDPETAFMFLTEQNIDPELNRVNAVGDWIGNETADRSKGQLSFRINTNTDRFPIALQASKKFYFLITGIPAGETEKSVLAYFPFKAENRPSSSSGIPVEAQPNYLTAQQTQGLLEGKQDALDFTPENIDNKVTSITVNSTDTQYPTAKAVFAAIDSIEIPEEGGSYTLPVATAETLGGVKIGAGITITEGVISVTSSPIVVSGDGITYKTIGEGTLGQSAINLQSQNTATKCATGYSSGTFGGAQNTASGSFSVTLGGQENTALSYNAVAMGKNTIAGANSQLAIGEYNVADPAGGENTKGHYCFIAGKGTSTIARANACAITWGGMFISSAIGNYQDTELWNNSWSIYYNSGLKYKYKNSEGTVTIVDLEAGGGTGLASVAVDDETITGDGTPENPLVAHVTGGSSSFDPNQASFLR